MNRTNNLCQKNKRYINSFYNAMTAVAVSIPVFAMNVIAAEEKAGDIAGKLNTLFKESFNMFSSVFNNASIFALGVCLFMLLFGRSSKSAETAYDWGKRVILAFIGFNLLTTFIPWISGIIGVATIA